MLDGAFQNSLYFIWYESYYRTNFIIKEWERKTIGIRWECPKLKGQFKKGRNLFKPVKEYIQKLKPKLMTLLVIKLLPEKSPSKSIQKKLKEY